MPNFHEAVEYLLGNEGGFFEDPVTGEVSNYGISLRWLKTIQPKATAMTIRLLTRTDAIHLYQAYWWTRYRIFMIPRDRVATKLLDTCVNIGAHTGVKILQATLNEPITTPAGRIAVDGLIGPHTARAVTRDCGFPDGEYGLLAAFCVNLGDYYREVAALNPELVKYLPGWEQRAEELPGVTSSPKPSQRPAGVPRLEDLNFRSPLVGKI